MVKGRAKSSGRRPGLTKAEPYIFMSPAMLALLLMFAYPLISCFYIAFQNYNLKELNNIYFIGFDNFTHLFKDKNIQMIAKNTLMYVTVCLAGQFLLGLILALTLWRPFRGRSLYQGIVFLPWAMSSFVVGLIFRWSFNGEYGVVNHVMMKLGIIQEKITWLGSPTNAIWVVIFAVVWMGIPFFGIMIMAALQSIPDDIFEAANIDGCGTIRKFFTITIPFIKPTLITTIMLRCIWIFNGVEMVMVVTEGGPGYHSEILSSYLYTKAYSSLDFGFAAALGIIFMIVLLVFIAIYLKVTQFSKAGDF